MAETVAIRRKTASETTQTTTATVAQPRGRIAISRKTTIWEATSLLAQDQSTRLRRMLLYPHFLSLYFLKLIPLIWKMAQSVQTVYNLDQTLPQHFLGDMRRFAPQARMSHPQHGQDYLCPHHLQHQSLPRRIIGIFLKMIQRQITPTLLNLGCKLLGKPLLTLPVLLKQVGNINFLAIDINLIGLQNGFQ